MGSEGVGSEVMGTGEIHSHTHASSGVLKWLTQSPVN